MLEIKISTDAALLILTERMRLELRMRKKAGQIEPECELTHLSFDELKSIAEAAVFDTVFLLPPDIFAKESNLADIIAKAMQSLARVYSKEDFYFYDVKKVERLIAPISKMLNIHEEDRSYYHN